MEVILSRRTFLKVMASGSVLGTLALFTGCQRKCSMATLEIIPRDEWHAVLPDVQESVEGVYDASTNPGGWYIYSKPLEEVLNTIVVHHSALPLSDGPLEIQEKHMHTKGYADIGYHFVIDAAGKIYAGRDLQVRGAHTGGHNTGTVGVVLLGNFEETVPVEAQLINLKQLCRCLRDTYSGITHLAGHRDFQPEVTVCPGENLEALLPELAKELRLEFGIGGYVGPPVP
jgi:hypothetical protein